MSKRMVILGAGRVAREPLSWRRRKDSTCSCPINRLSNPKYKEMLDNHGIRWEEGQHTEADILSADEIVKSRVFPTRLLSYSY